GAVAPREPGSRCRRQESRPQPSQAAGPGGAAEGRSHRRRRSPVACWIRRSPPHHRKGQLSPNAAVMHDSPMSRVVVVTTGGTIASIADDSGVLRPARTGADLLGDAYREDVEVVDVTA